MASYTLRGLSLCSGGGGLELGLLLAEPGYQTVCSVEWDEFAVGIQRARMREGCLHDAPIWDDVSTFDGRPWRGSVDILSAGYPCQPFSAAGKRQGEADPRHLWPHVRRIAAETAAPILFLENVRGHLSLGFDTVQAELRGMGYRIAAGLFSALEVGASHERQRLFCLAYADGGGLRELAGLDCVGQPDDVPDAEGHASACGDHRGVGVLELPVGPAGGDWGGDGAGDPGPLFPPHPGDLEEWARIIGADPGAKPALPRSADGMAGWMDRGRMLGNGVCPLAAAYAYRSLTAALGGMIAS